MKSQQDFLTITEYREYLKIYFAGLAMQGLCTLPNDPKISPKQNARLIATNAVTCANELVNNLIPMKR